MLQALRALRISFPIKGRACAFSPSAKFRYTAHVPLSWPRVGKFKGVKMSSGTYPTAFDVTKVEARIFIPKRPRFFSPYLLWIFHLVYFRFFIFIFIFIVRNCWLFRKAWCRFNFRLTHNPLSHNSVSILILISSRFIPQIYFNLTVVIIVLSWYSRLVLINLRLNQVKLS